MGLEINEERIRELEKKINEGIGDPNQLKIARNLLLNISTRVPPEILGQTFCWRVLQDLHQFNRLRKRTYDFLLVCHHWLEVAYSTPELWSYWGHTLKQWFQRYKRSGSAPIDLVLNDMIGSKLSFDGPLRDALQERAKQDTIRSVRLTNEDSPILASVLSVITPDDGDIRYTSIESIRLRCMDASNFFTRCRFPKLSYLFLSMGVQLSWDHLALHTTALTTLILTIGGMESRIPTTTQLLSVLASNPRLQTLKLSNPILSRDDGDTSTITVPLRHLKKLHIHGNFRPVFRLLQRLAYPERMDKMKLTVSRSTVEEISGILGPYVHDFIQRDGRFRDGLEIFLEHDRGSVSIRLSAIKNVERPPQKATFATFTAGLRKIDSRHENVELCTKLVAYIPVEYVVRFGGDLSMDVAAAVVSIMPNIQELYLINACLGDGFLQPDPKGPLPHQKLLPSLQRLHLENAVPDDDSWSPLLSYLSHQTSDGQRISLTITSIREHICKDVVKEMEGLVDELVLDLILDDDCPFDWCVSSEEEDE